MNITKEQLKETLRTIMAEESEYQTFFKKALEKAGKSIPSMSDEEKKAFFNKIDAAWDGKGEKNEELTGNQHKLDVDGDGEIEASDLAALRAKKDESVNEKVIKGKDAGNFVKMAAAGKTLKIDDDVYTSLGKGKWKGPNGEKLNWIEVASMASALGNKEVVFEGAEEFAKESVNEGISVSDERHFGKTGIIIMIDDNGKKVSAIFKDKKNADKFNRNNPSDIKKLLDLAKKTKYPKAIDESVDEAYGGPMAIRSDEKLKIGQTIKAEDEKGKSQLAKVVKYSGNGIYIIKPIKEESVNEDCGCGYVKEGVSSKDMEAIKAAVQAASSFMNIGSELKKMKMRYIFATSPMPVYIVQPTPNNKVAIVNKKYADKPDFVVGDTAVGVMENVQRLSEGSFSEIDIMIQNAKTFNEFVREFYKDFRDFPKDKETGKWLKSLYSSKNESVNEGRAFVQAARKAKEEGKTEFEFNGKTYPVTLKEVVTEDASMNKKVKAFLDKGLRDLTKGKPNHHFAVMNVLMGALTDANFHSEAKKVPSIFPKAKYEGDPMGKQDTIRIYEEMGENIASICKWDGKDIVDAIGFYVSMTIGRPVGEKVEKLVESINEAIDLLKNKK